MSLLVTSFPSVPHIQREGSALLRLLVLDVYVSTGEKEDFLRELVRLSDHRSQSAYVCFVNVHMLVEANRDSKFREIVNQADICCPDGLPVAISVGWFYAIRQAQIAGPDTLPRLMEMAGKLRRRIFILGSTDAVVERFRERAAIEHPDVVICGHFCPPFRTLLAEEDDLIVEQINRSRADMIFVALGCPKQEKWMASHRGRVNGCMFGLGYAIPVYAGVESRAPRWMIEHGLEWFFRLSSDPKRLFKRYVETNSVFIRGMVLRWFFIRLEKVYLFFHGKQA